MSTRSQVNFEWGTAVEIAATALTAREVVVDTTNQRLILMDGVINGGHPVASEAFVTAAIASLAAGLSQNLTLSRRCI
jgi:hypothetical protein